MEFKDTEQRFAWIKKAFMTNTQKKKSEPKYEKTLIQSQDIIYLELLELSRFCFAFFMSS